MKIKLIFMLITISIVVNSQEIFREKRFTTKIFPISVAVDKDKNVFVADRANYCVQKYDNKGNHKLSFGIKSSSQRFKEEEGAVYSLPSDLFIYDNLLYLLDMNNGIFIFNLDGVIQGKILFKNGELLGEFSRPQAIYVDDQYIYLTDTDNHRIQILTKTGNSVSGFGYRGAVPGTFYNPTGISKIRDKILVSDTDNRRITIYNKNGLYDKRLDKEVDVLSPTDLFVDDLGYIYITDRGKNKIFVFDKNFKPILAFGKGGSKDSQFNGIRDVWVTNEYIYVADYSNNSIKVFDKDINFVRIIGKNNIISLIVNGFFIFLALSIFLIILYNVIKRIKNNSNS